MRINNDPRSILGEDEDILNGMPVSSYSNVMFEETYNSQCHYFWYEAIKISTKKNIKRGKELFIDYGAD